MVTENGVSLVGLNDSTLLEEFNDSLYGINVGNAQTYNIGKIGYFAVGDLSWYGNDLYMKGTNGVNTDGLLIKIVLNSTYNQILNSTSVNNITNPIPECLGLATVSINGSQSLIGFADTSGYIISPIDGTYQLLCSSLHTQSYIYGAASISFPTTLPIHLLNFSYTLLNKTVNLQWQTATEINSNYFLIERSPDGTNFTTIGKLPAAGNSSTTKTYSFADNLSSAIYHPSTFFYRLKELDLNGNATYSNTLSVKLPRQTALTILQNPVQNTLQLQINTSTTRKTNTLMLYDFSGRRLKTLSASNGPQTINISSLPASTYILQLITSSGQIFNQQFIKTN